MNLTVLLDMDDTLLKNDMDTFVPNYLGAFSRFLSSYMDTTQFVDVLLYSTEKMAQNNRPDKSLKDVFDENFYPTLNLDQETFTEIADKFYREVYPELRQFTSKIPGVRELIEELFHREDTVAVITNPLFPLYAIEQRLDWAGVPSSEFPYALISSYETFHFAKPNPAFFAEVLLKLLWQKGPVLVIGDDLGREIEPSKQIGLASFWVNDSSENSNYLTSKREGVGTILDILPWIDSLDEDILNFDFTNPSAVVSLLRASPAVFDSLFRETSSDIVKMKPNEKEWSVIEIICHLKDVDQDVNIPRVSTIIKENEPFIEGADTHPWVSERRCWEEDSAQLLRSFIEKRIELVQLLESLPPDAWQREAQHAILGRTTLLELMRIVVEHDMLHIKQAYEAIEFLSN